MKILKLALFFALSALWATSVFGSDIKSGEDLVAAMNKKYQSKWYKTLTFVQKTITHKEDGTDDIAIWHEALNAPGQLRIDILPLEKADGILFTGETLYQIKEGKVAGKRPFVHPLLVLGFDVYVQPVAKTLEQMKGLNIDMSVVHEEKWQGKTVCVVGAKQGDLTSPQLWVEKKNLLFVRLIEARGKDKKTISETQFNDYRKMKGGGWVSAEVLFFTNGKKTVTEIYSDIQTGMKLDADLWNSEKWLTVDRNYFKIK
jgi:outer membrane lipoprotein-sorting protein